MRVPTSLGAPARAWCADRFRKHRPLVLAGGGSLLILQFLGAGVLGGVPTGDSPAPAAPEVALPITLPVEMNRQVERWMGRYLSDLRPIFQRYLEREGLYADMIREALRTRGMPEELVYLAAIESGFSPGAVSHMSAVGMWQFMGPTARAYGLRIDAYVDERRDPIRATEAALTYLQTLYDRFGSWYLAAAAYNAGPTRVAEVVSRYPESSSNEDLFWEIVEDLPVETRVYVPKILAAILLAQAAEIQGFRVERSAPVRFERVWVPGGTSLATIAMAVGVPTEQIRELNPHLILGITPPGEPFGARVPPGRSLAVVASLGNRWRTIALVN